MVKKREGRIKFKAERDPEELMIKVGKAKTGRASIPIEERKFRTLRKKCFNEKNSGLLGMIKTSEKLDN